MSVNFISGDRRIDRRYVFSMSLRFSYTEHGVTKLGSGTTVDLSGGGVLFQADTPPPNGATAELRIDWPFLLQGTCPLELQIWGTIISTTERGTSLQFNRYEFRTRGERSFFESQPTTGGHCTTA
jgi:hypothetical protein